MKKLLLLLCGLMTLTAIPRPDTADTARQASLRRLEARADSGDARACFWLSSMLEQGTEGFAPDTAKALALLRTAADSAYAPAMNYLGYAYAVPLLGLTQDPDSALMWIERAAMSPRPDPKAFNNLGMLLLTGQHGVRRDYAKARYWLARGSEMHVPTATASLAKIYLEGLGTKPDTAQAVTLLRRAAAQGLTDAGMQLADLVLPPADTLPPADMLDLALTYYHDRIWPVAIPLLRRAAKAQEPLALAILAQCHAEGLGVPYDHAKALDLYIQAAALGEPHAGYILAETLQTFPDMAGTCPALDPETLYRQAAEAGVTDAAEALAPLRP